MSENIMTVPEEIQEYHPVYLTGNQYISVPDIDPKHGGVRSVNALHMGAKGLLEFRGDEKAPLLMPYLRVNKEEIIDSNSNELPWKYVHSWIPSFEMDFKGLFVQGTVFFPPGHRGGVYLLKVKNTGERYKTLEAGFQVNWARFNQVLFKSREVEVQQRLFFNDWTGSLVMEASSGLPLVSMALGTAGGRAWDVEDSEQGVQRAACGEKIYLAPGEEKSVPLYITLNIEGDGAATTLVDLRRHGFKTLYEETVDWLKERELFSEGETLRYYETPEGESKESQASKDKKTAKTENYKGAEVVTSSFHSNKIRVLANQNLFFNYFYAQGRTIDTEELVPVTSRSPRYYVSAAFWSRDCLLWSFPGLLLAEPKTAREVLARVYTHHLDKAGEHAHYINGVLLYPGFELDQLSAYLLALKNYVKSTGDWKIIKEELFQKGIGLLAEKLISHRDENTGLFSTFLDPSDDPVKYPFLIYDNALAQRAMEFLAELEGDNLISMSRACTESCGGKFKRMAEGLKENIYRLGVVEGPLGPMFAWSVDGRGNYELYDNPPGSLQLLVYYEFCSKDDPIYINTVQWINSHHNPYFFGTGEIVGAASRHAGNPWPLSGVNDLLALNLWKGRFFQKASMDNGFFCETVDPSTGRASTGLAFASASGFLAYALWKAYARFPGVKPDPSFRIEK